MTSSLPSVAVHAAAHRDVTPDRFDIVVRLACRGNDAVAAAQGLTTGFARVEAQIEALPAELDVVVRRSGVSLRKVTWRPDRPGVTEWIASRQVTLAGGDVEQAGAVIAPFAALTDSVDGPVDIELDGPSWHLDRDNPVHGELQAQAVHEALARAKRYAAALGGTLGSLIELSDPHANSGWHRANAVQLGYAAGGEGFETMDFSPVPVTVEEAVEGRWALILP